MRSDRAARSAGGFALLEAIVALAIMAASGLALFAALSQSLQMIVRADAAFQRGEAIRNALAVVATIDPMKTPSGTREMGGLRLAWRASLLEPEEGSATGTLATGYYRLGLYQLDCVLSDGGNEIAEFRVRKVGYRQVRQPVPFE